MMINILLKKNSKQKTENSRTSFHLTVREV